MHQHHFTCFCRPPLVLRPCGAWGGQQNQPFSTAGPSHLSNPRQSVDSNTPSTQSIAQACTVSSCSLHCGHSSRERLLLEGWLRPSRDRLSAGPCEPTKRQEDRPPAAAFALPMGAAVEVRSTRAEESLTNEPSNTAQRARRQPSRVAKPPTPVLLSSNKTTKSARKHCQSDTFLPTNHSSSSKKVIENKDAIG